MPEEEKKKLGVWTDKEFKDEMVQALAMGAMVGIMSFALSWIAKYQAEKRKK